VAIDPKPGNFWLNGHLIQTEEHKNKK